MLLEWGVEREEKVHLFKVNFTNVFFKGMLNNFDNDTARIRTVAMLVTAAWMSILRSLLLPWTSLMQSVFTDGFKMQYLMLTNSERQLMITLALSSNHILFCNRKAYHRSFFKIPLTNSSIYADLRSMSFPLKTSVALQPIAECYITYWAKLRQNFTFCSDSNCL